METLLPMSRYPQQCDIQGRIEVNIFTGLPERYSETERIIDLSESRNPLDQWRRLTCREFMGKPIPRPLIVQDHKPRGDEIWCSRCERHKPHNAFSKANNARGKHYWCKDCRADHERTKYHTGKVNRSLARVGATLNR